MQYWILEKAEIQSIDAFELWCWWRLENHWGYKEINPKGNQPWIFIGRIHTEAEAPILWPLNVKSQLTGKLSDWATAALVHIGQLGVANIFKVLKEKKKKKAYHPKIVYLLKIFLVNKDEIRHYFIIEN